jgi:hypothetical protein
MYLNFIYLIKLKAYHIITNLSYTNLNVCDVLKKTVKPIETIDAADLRAKNSKNSSFTLLCSEDPDINEVINDSRDSIIIDELKRYKSMHIEVSENLCPLLFYQNHIHDLPNLSKIAEMIFCTTASSVPSECVFSTAGEIIRKKRTRLRPKLTEELIILNKN